VGPLSTADTATVTVAARGANGGDAAGTLVAADHGAAATETQVPMHQLLRFHARLRSVCPAVGAFAAAAAAAATTIAPALNQQALPDSNPPLAPAKRGEPH
jgi:hypothetical protein